MIIRSFLLAILIILCSILIRSLLIKVSGVAMDEKVQIESNPEYGDYIFGTIPLILWFP